MHTTLMILMQFFVCVNVLYSCQCHVLKHVLNRSKTTLSLHVDYPGAWIREQLYTFVLGDRLWKETIFSAAFVHLSC